MMAELGDEDDFPNDFDGLDFDNIPGLQAPTINGNSASVYAPSSVVLQNATLSTAASPAPSTGSNNTEDMDPIFLAAVDALEARALSEQPRGTESTKEFIDTHTSKTALDSHKSGDTSSLDQVHGYSMPPTESSSTNRKGKRKAGEDIDVRAILAGYETELTCPICCDLLVGAQVANPCGHTCCGECGYGWLSQNKYEPTCAVCRSSLYPRNPLLPNFSVDGFVRQHLQALARSGRPDWQERGYKTIEWNKRVESWKRQNDARAAKEKLKETARQRWRQSRYFDSEAADPSYVPPWLTDEGTEDDRPLVVMTRRGTRSRR